MAIDSLKIDRSYRQVGNSCLLSSFAVVGNYFTNEPIGAFFKGYFDVFINDFASKGVSFIWNADKFEFAFWQGCHINSLGRNGYDILYRDLYNSNNLIYEKCRNSFKCQNRFSINETGHFIDGEFKGRQINDVLETEEAIINIFLNEKINSDNTIWKNIPHGHSIAIYFDSRFFYHDTNNPKDMIEIDQTWDWWKYKRIGDKMISWKEQ